MSTAPHTFSPQLRQSLYWLLIAIGAAAVLGRILAVDAIDQAAIQEYRISRALGDKERSLRAKGLEGEPLDAALQREEARLREIVYLQRPFLSANDRSRWATVRALVEPSMSVPDAPYAIDNVIQQRGWDTIDMVSHDGHLYSSKPPLFPTIMAAQYWVIYHLTGMSLDTHPYTVGRIMLVTFSLVPLLIYFWMLARLIERFGTTDWGRLFVMATAVFGTFLTTFAIVINNHLPAAVCALGALYASIRIWFDGERRMRYFACAGLLAALAAANELPAASFFALLTATLSFKAPRQTLVAYLPPVLLVAAGFFGTNWIAHHSLRPPYMHRSATDKQDNWYDYTYQRNGVVCESYWNNRQGIDRGETSPVAYAFHVLIGHHGIFSLTPVWLLSVAGALLWLLPTRDRRLRELALLVAVLSLVCIVFYIARPLVDRNYGGMSAGFRWVFWLAPLWLLSMLPAADALAPRPWLRRLALLLLAVSVLSASYPTWNPWTHPWLMNYLHSLGCLGSFHVLP